MGVITWPLAILPLRNKGPCPTITWVLIKVRFKLRRLCRPQNPRLLSHKKVYARIWCVNKKVKVLKVRIICVFAIDNYLQSILDWLIKSRQGLYAPLYPRGTERYAMNAPLVLGRMCHAYKVKTFNQVKTNYIFSNTDHWVRRANTFTHPTPTGSVCKGRPWPLSCNSLLHRQTKWYLQEKGQALGKWTTQKERCPGYSNEWRQTVQAWVHGNTAGRTKTSKHQMGEREVLSWNG